MEECRVIAAAARLKSLMNGLKGRAAANCTSKALLHYYCTYNMLQHVVILPIALPTHCTGLHYGCIVLLHYDCTMATL